MSELKILDIPPGVAEELARLYKLFYIPDTDLNVWARERITAIHKVFFCGMIYVPETATITP